MKTKTLKVAAAMSLGALLVGSAAAQESASKPVGYETLDYTGGFNYLGLRLVNSPAATAVVTASDAGTVTLDADPGLAAGSYLIENATGVVAVVDSIAGAVVSTPDGGMFAVDDAVTIREVQTLASVFGAANESGIGAGQGGPVGSDQVWLPDGSGGFDKYYYFEDPFMFSPSEWKNVATDASVDPATVSIVYTDGIVMSASNAGSLVVTGSVKLTPTTVGLTSTFNYLSTIYPAGTSLATAFGADNTAGLDPGNGGPVGSDQVWVPAVGGFDKYYYFVDPFMLSPAEWKDVASNASVDSTTVSLDDSSGIIVVNGGAQNDASLTAPSFYENL